MQDIKSYIAIFPDPANEKTFDNMISPKISKLESQLQRYSTGFERIEEEKLEEDEKTGNTLYNRRKSSAEKKEALNEISITI